LWDEKRKTRCDRDCASVDTFDAAIRLFYETRADGIAEGLLDNRSVCFFFEKSLQVLRSVPEVGLDFVGDRLEPLDELDDLDGPCPCVPGERAGL
jgi:hypothetical protein